MSYCCEGRRTPFPRDNILEKCDVCNGKCSIKCGAITTECHKCLGTGLK